MAMTVTATQGGATANGIFSRVFVLTQAADLASQTGAAVNFAFVSTQTWTRSITTTQTGSRVYGAAAHGSTVTDAAAALTTLVDSQADSGNSWQYVTFKATSLTGTPGATTLGFTFSPTGSSGPFAMFEVKTGGTLTEDASAPAPVWLTNAITVTSASFTPPAGSLLVALVASNGGATVTTMTVSDTGGPGGWVEKSVNNPSGNDYAGVWVAQTAAGGVTATATLYAATAAVPVAGGAAGSGARRHDHCRDGHSPSGGGHHRAAVRPPVRDRGGGPRRRRRHLGEPRERARHRRQYLRAWSIPVMAVGYVGAGTLATSTSGTVTGNWGSLSRSAGNLLVWCVTAIGNTSASSISTPAGWSKYVEETASTYVKIAWYWKIAAGSDALPAAFTSTLAGTYLSMTALPYELSGTHATTPFATSTGTGVSGTTANPLTGVTTAGNVPDAACWALAAHAIYRATTAANAWTKDASWTNAATDGGTSQRPASAHDRITAAPVRGCHVDGRGDVGEHARAGGRVAGRRPVAGQRQPHRHDPRGHHDGPSAHGAAGHLTRA